MSAQTCRWPPNPHQVLDVRLRCTCYKKCACAQQAAAWRPRQRRWRLAVRWWQATTPWCCHSSAGPPCAWLPRRSTPASLWSLRGCTSWPRAPLPQRPLRLCPTAQRAQQHPFARPGKFIHSRRAIRLSVTSDPGLARKRDATSVGAAPAPGTEFCHLCQVR